jgi:hypothetical protein
MTRRINYEDDIFSLALQVRCLRDILRLEIDPEFFRERIVADLASLDATISRIAQSLRASPSFAGRQDHLKELRRLELAFAEALADILDKRAPFWTHLADRVGSLGEMQASRAQEAADIGKMLAGGSAGPDEGEHMVSTEELKILFAPPEEEQ